MGANEKQLIPRDESWSHGKYWRLTVFFDDDDDDADGTSRNRKRC